MSLPQSVFSYPRSPVSNNTRRLDGTSRGRDASDSSDSTAYTWRSSGTSTEEGSDSACTSPDPSPKSTFHFPRGFKSTPKASSTSTETPLAPGDGRSYPIRRLSLRDMPTPRLFALEPRSAGDLASRIEVGAKNEPSLGKSLKKVASQIRRLAPSSSRRRLRKESSSASLFLDGQLSKTGRAHTPSSPYPFAVQGGGWSAIPGLVPGDVVERDDPADLPPSPKSPPPPPPRPHREIVDVFHRQAIYNVPMLPRSNRSNDFGTINDPDRGPLSARPPSPAFPFPRMPESVPTSSILIRRTIHPVPSDVAQSFGVVPPPSPSPTPVPPLPRRSLSYKDSVSALSSVSSFGTKLPSSTFSPRPGPFFDPALAPFHRRTDSPNSLLANSSSPDRATRPSSPSLHSPASQVPSLQLEIGPPAVAWLRGAGIGAVPSSRFSDWTPSSKSNSSYRTAESAGKKELEGELGVEVREKSGGGTVDAVAPSGIGAGRERGDVGKGGEGSMASGADEMGQREDFAVMSRPGNGAPMRRNSMEDAER